MKKLASLILAVAMILSVCAFAEEAAEEVAVMTYDEFMAAAIDDQVCVETYVQANQSWWDGKITLYTQTEEGAYFVYNAECDEGTAALLVPGTAIRVTGYKAEWSGEIEIADATIEILEAEEPWIAEPVDVTELLGTDELINYQNQLVTFTNVTIEPYSYTDEGETVTTENAFAYKWNGTGEQGDDLYFNVSVGGTTYTFTVESYLCGKDTEIYQAIEALEVGETVTLDGFLYWYNGVNPHITAISRG